MVIVIRDSGYDKEVIYNDNILYIEKACEVKDIEDEHNILILLDLDIDNNGVIKNHQFFLEEVVISIKVDTIISNTPNEKVKEICDFHKINYFRL